MPVIPDPEPAAAPDAIRSEIDRLWQSVVAVATEHKRRIALIDSAERDCWGAVGEYLVPDASAVTLAAVADLLGASFPADVLMQEHAETHKALQQTLAQLAADELSDSEFKRVSLLRDAHSAQLERCVSELMSAREPRRTELKARRADLEAEGQRLASRVAAHHRSRNRADAVRRELADLVEQTLVRARRAVVEACFRLAATDVERVSARDSIVGEWLVRVAAVRAKREVIQEAFNQQLRPPGAELTELRRTFESADAFQIASFPPRARLLGESLQRGIAAYERKIERALAVTDFPTTPPPQGWKAWLLSDPPVGAPAADTIPADAAARALHDALNGETLQDDIDAFEHDTGVFTTNAPRPAPQSTTRAKPHSTLAPGQRLGRYEIRGLIGRGGMAEVYLAVQHGADGFGKTVVVKRMNDAHDGDDLALRMFTQEARIAAALSHPNIVQIYDLQRIDDELVIVMEYLEGAALHKASLRGPDGSVAVPHAVRVLIDAARALAYAHAQVDEQGSPLRLVHRDVSPDNIFVTRSGCAKLLDFGIARRNDLTLMTESGSLKGKIAFMAPEQIRGEDLDGRADLFALGVTAYWLFSGKRPFRGSNEANVLNAVLTKKPEDLRTLRPDLPRELAELIAALMEKDAASRPRDAGEVLRVLQQLSTSTWEEVAAAAGFV